MLDTKVATMMKPNTPKMIYARMNFRYSVLRISVAHYLEFVANAPDGCDAPALVVA